MGGTTVKKILIGIALSALLGFASLSYANDKVLKVDGFQGGFEVFTAWNGYCIMRFSEPGANFIFANAVAAKANGWDIWLYNSNQAGWGFGADGGLTCTNIYVQ